MRFTALLLSFAASAFACVVLSSLLLYATIDWEARNCALEGPAGSLCHAARFYIVFWWAIAVLAIPPFTAYLLRSK